MNIREKAKEYLFKLNDVACSNTDDDLNYHRVGFFLRESIEVDVLHESINLIKDRIRDENLNRETEAHYRQLIKMIDEALTYHGAKEKECKAFEKLLVGKENE